MGASLQPGAGVGGGGDFGNDDRGASGCRMSYKNSGIIGTEKEKGLNFRIKFLQKKSYNYKFHLTTKTL